MRRFIVPSFRVLLLLFAWDVSSFCANLPRLVAFGGQSPFVITDPKNATNIVEGETATFSVVAGGTEPLEYQWLKDSQPIAGATESRLTLSDLKTGYAAYQAVVRNGFGAITSNPALLLVWRKVPPVFTGGGGPASQQVAEGQLVGLYAFVASPSPVSYQWFKNGAPIANATEPNLTIGSVTSEDAGEYTVSARNAYGESFSAPATISLLEGPPLIESQPPSSITVKRGEPLTLTVRVTGKEPFEFRWFQRRAFDDWPIEGATSATLHLPQSEFSDAGAYFVEVRNPVFAVRSERISVEVAGEPVILLQPPERTDLLPSQTSLLKVMATVATWTDSFRPKVAWYRNGEKILEHQDLNWVGNRVGDLNTFDDSLSVSGWDAVYEMSVPGDYFAVITDRFGSTTSAVARLEIKLPEPKRSPAPAPPDLREGLVAYWPFDDSQGNLFKDSIGHYDLEFLSPPGFFAGRNGRAVSLLGEPGEPTGVFHAKETDELPINRHRAFSISLWNKVIFRSNLYRIPYLFREGNSNDSSRLFAFMPDYRNGYTSQMSALFRLANPPVENVDFGSERLIIGSLWRHVVFVQEQDGRRWFYIDGVESDIALPPRPPGDWKLDYTQIGGFENLQFPGVSAMFCCVPSDFLIDDVALWKRALTAEEIRILMTNGIPGFEPTPLTIQSLSLDSTRKSLALQWNAVGDGLYSLLKSTNVAGPWTIVTNKYPSGVNGFTVTNAFTDSVPTTQTTFYQVRKSPF